MNITPNKLTIAQLFASRNEQFQVPSYQRRYAWGHNQIVALFEDIEMLKEGDGHLFGMIILHTDYHTGGLNCPEVVDGQQRLTTLAILLRALKEVFDASENSEKVQEIHKMLTCSGLDNVQVPKLLLGDLDHADLVALMSDNSEYEYTNEKIVDAYNHFFERLDEMSERQLNEFYFKLTNVAVIIRLDVGMARDAYKLFETINNRGLRLSPTDIIKNFLLGHAAKMNAEVLSETKSLWSDIIITLDGLDTNDFFRQYMCSLLRRKISKNNLVTEFKQYYFNTVEGAELLGEYDYFVADPILDEDTIEDDDDSDLQDDEFDEVELPETTTRKNINQILREMRNTAKVYRSINFASFEDVKIKRHVEYLNKIQSKPAYIFLMHLLQRPLSSSLKVEVLRVLETFMLRRHICEERTGAHDGIFASLVSTLDKPDVLSAVKAKLSEHLPDDEDFRMSFPKHKFDGRMIDRAKYVLGMIEYHMRGNTGELVVSSDNEVHLEHIVPQKISTSRSKQEFGDWVTYLGQNSVIKHKKYVDLIGNMTLLADRLNIQAYNNPFAKKKASYRSSSFLITNELAGQNDFGFYHIEKRGEKLAEIALSIWRF